MPPPTPPRSKMGSERDDKPVKRRRPNSAPPFVGTLPFRLRESSPQSPVHLPRIDEMLYNTPSDEYTEESPEPPHPAVTTKPDPEETEDEPEYDEEESNRLCEFSTPCYMNPSPDGMHYRKVVSHVFGRNKASTKLFPDSVWVHYCRKHYQRARYRADQWPFTQCDLLMESLSRMEKWGGVESFELTLRRREVLRVEEESLKSTPDIERGKPEKRKKANGNRVLASGRKHPTAIVAPVPSWMLACLGKGKTFNDIRAVISAAHDHMREMAENVGSSKTPAKQSGTPQKQAVSSTVRFPDIEILPSFKPWVHVEAQKKREARNEASRGPPLPTAPSNQSRTSRARGNPDWQRMVSGITGGQKGKKQGKKDSQKKK